jgi:hypothetical protein
VVQKREQAAAAEQRANLEFNTPSLSFEFNSSTDQPTAHLQFILMRESEPRARILSAILLRI